MLLTLGHGTVMASVRAGLHSLKGRRLRPVSRAVALALALALAFAGCARPAARSVQREAEPGCVPSPIAKDAIVLSTLSQSRCMVGDRMQDQFDLTFDSTTLVRVVASSPDFAVSVGIGERDGPLGAGAAGPRGGQAPSILYLAGAGKHRVTIIGTGGQYRLTLQSNPTITRCESITIMPGTTAALPLRAGLCRDSLRPGDGLYNTARFTLMYRSPGSRITVNSSDFTPTITLRKGSTAWPDAPTSSTTLDYPCPDCTGANFMTISGTRPSDSGTFTIRVESKPNG